MAAASTLSNTSLTSAGAASLNPAAAEMVVRVRNDAFAPPRVPGITTSTSGAGGGASAALVREFRLSPGSTVLQCTHLVAVAFGLQLSNQQQHQQHQQQQQAAAASSNNATTASSSTRWRYSVSRARAMSVDRPASDTSSATDTAGNSLAPSVSMPSSSTTSANTNANTTMSTSTPSTQLLPEDLCLFWRKKNLVLHAHSLLGSYDIPAQDEVVLQRYPTPVELQVHLPNGATIPTPYSGSMTCVSVLRTALQVLQPRGSLSLITQFRVDSLPHATKSQREWRWELYHPAQGVALPEQMQLADCAVVPTDHLHVRVQPKLAKISVPLPPWSVVLRFFPTTQIGEAIAMLVRRIGASGNIVGPPSVYGLFVVQNKELAHESAYDYGTIGTRRNKLRNELPAENETLLGVLERERARFGKYSGFWLDEFRSFSSYGITSNSMLLLRLNPKKLNVTVSSVSFTVSAASTGVASTAASPIVAPLIDQANAAAATTTTNGSETSAALVAQASARRLQQLRQQPTRNLNHSVITVQYREQGIVKRKKVFFDTTVRDVVQQLCTVYSISSANASLGLFLPFGRPGELHAGRWLEDSDSITSYTVSADDVLQLRVFSDANKTNKVGLHHKHRTRRRAHGKQPNEAQQRQQIEQQQQQQEDQAQLSDTARMNARYACPAGTCSLVHSSLIGDEIEVLIPHMNLIKTVRFDPDTLVVQIKQWLLTPCTNANATYWFHDGTIDDNDQSNMFDAASKTGPLQRTPSNPNKLVAAASSTSSTNVAAAAAAASGSSPSLSSSADYLQQTPSSQPSQSPPHGDTSTTDDTNAAAATSVSVATCTKAMAEHERYQLQIAGCYPPIVLPIDQPLASCAVGTGVRLELVLRNNRPVDQLLPIVANLIPSPVPAPCRIVPHRPLPTPLAITVHVPRSCSIRSLIDYVLRKAALASIDPITDLLNFAAYLPVQGSQQLQLLNPDLRVCDYPSVFDTTVLMCLHCPSTPLPPNAVAPPAIAITAASEQPQPQEHEQQQQQELQEQQPPQALLTIYIARKGIELVPEAEYLHGRDVLRLPYDSSTTCHSILCRALDVLASEPDGTHERAAAAAASSGRETESAKNDECQARLVQYGLLLRTDERVVAWLVASRSVYSYGLRANSAPRPRGARLWLSRKPVRVKVVFQTSLAQPISLVSEVSVENLLLTNDPKDGNNTSSAVQTLLVGQWTRYRLVGDLIRELDRFEGMCHCTELVGVYRVSQECWLDNSTHLRSLDLRENELLKVLVKPRPISLYYLKDGQVEYSHLEVCLDLTVPLYQHIPRLVYECRFDIEKPITFRSSLSERETSVLDLRMSLISQGYFVGMTLVAEQLTELDDSSSTAGAASCFDLVLPPAPPPIAEDEEALLLQRGEEVLFTRTADFGVEVRVATLQKLIEMLTAENHQDHVFRKTFIHTYKSFITSEKLLAKLIERYNVTRPHELTEDEFQRTVQTPIRLRVINALKYWIDQAFDDIESEVVASIVSFIDNTIEPDGHKLPASMLRNAIQKQVSASEQPQTLQGFDSPPPPKLPRSFPGGGGGTGGTGSTGGSGGGGGVNGGGGSVSFYDIEDVEIARQLTIMDFQLFVRIKPTEFLNQAWTKPKLQHRCRNLLAIIEHFNVVSSWVATMVLNCETVRMRAKAMAKMINIAKHLKRLNNFLGLTAFVAAFNTSAISRLKWTQQQLSKKASETKAFLERCVSSSSSYKEYRALLERSASIPCIPLLAVHLSDLVFIEEGNADTINGYLINFTKRKQIYEVISLMMKHQRKMYVLQAVPELQQLFSNPPHLPEETLYQISLMREPRGATACPI